ncbi:unnamed protein product [Callosobruchus maculatus]|nr:unnamed protein product [Callosobruchus maculatus]
MRFSIQPAPGDTGFTQWVTAMKMVAQLPGGIPPEFRRRLWLQLAERHLQSRGVNWAEVERTCLTEWQNPGDGELGVQIVKDLHRTGCSLFCGEGGRQNQALLKRVLLAYARWNKAVGYCQGFNMLAALMLQVTDRCESDALKLMIYLIEGVLPDSYFADSLRGLSVDMAVFRELLRSRLPALSKHLDKLQTAAKDGGRCYEPPLTNVFTMQWFLTLFCNCLPHTTVLRVWDLILLEGNEILLRTALAIWQVLAEKIMTVRSADEFYCVMGVLTREILESGLIDSNSLIKAIVSFGSLTELKTLREHYTYNINPWGSTGLPHVVDKQVKVYPRPLALDITVLKKQYDRLRQRQREARVILGAVAGATSSAQPCPARPALNHLLVGRPALGPPAKDRPKAPGGSVPPPRVLEQRPVQRVGSRIPKGGTLHWKDAPQEKKKGDGVVEAKKVGKSPSSTSSSDTELCDESEPSSSDQEDNIDNLPEDSSMVVTNDNIAPVVPDSVEAKLIEPTSNVAVIEVEESNDPEFERFLSDRLKSLKADEPKEEEKTSYSRRNSERAFQIMQENSMILHRILQCQTRMSPSPPSYADPDTEAHEPEVKIDELETRSVEDVQSPVYGSKYTSILEKSKSLDEKYNTLILNQPLADKDIPTQSSSLQEDLYKKIYYGTVAEGDEKDIEIDSLYLGCYNDSKDDNICTNEEQQSKDTLVINTAAQLDFYPLNSDTSLFSLSQASVNAFDSETVGVNIITEGVKESQRIQGLECNEFSVTGEDSKNDLYDTTPTKVPILDYVNLKTDITEGVFSSCAKNVGLLGLSGMENNNSEKSDKILSNISETSYGESSSHNYKPTMFLDKNEQSVVDASNPHLFYSDAILLETDKEYVKKSLIDKENIEKLNHQAAEVGSEVKSKPEKQVIEKSEYLLDDNEIELCSLNSKNDTGSQSTNKELNLSHGQYLDESTVGHQSVQAILEQSSIYRDPSSNIQQFTPNSLTNLTKLPYLTSNFEPTTIGIPKEPSLPFSDTQSQHDQSINNLEYMQRFKEASFNTCETKEQTIFDDSSPQRNFSNCISELVVTNKIIPVLPEAMPATHEDKSSSPQAVLSCLESFDEKQQTKLDQISSQSRTHLDELSNDISELMQANKSITILPQATSPTYEDKSPATHKVLFSNLIELGDSQQFRDVQDKTMLKADFEVPNSHLSEQDICSASNYSPTFSKESQLSQETDNFHFSVCSNKDEMLTDSQGAIVYSAISEALDQLTEKALDRKSLASSQYSPSEKSSNDHLPGLAANVKVDLETNKFPYDFYDTIKDTSKSGDKLSETTSFPRYEAYLKKIAATKSLKLDSCDIKSVIEVTDIPDRCSLDGNVDEELVRTANSSENITSKYLRELYSQKTFGTDENSDKDSGVSLCPPRSDNALSSSDSSFSNLSRYTSENADRKTQSQ